MTGPIIIFGEKARRNEQQPIAITGGSFGIYEWKGSGPDYLHVHHADDEAWHILEGKLIFRFADGQVETPAGATVFVPAGVPHSYSVGSESTRYLIILSPRLHELIENLQTTPREKHSEIMREFQSEILE